MVTILTCWIQNNYILLIMSYVLQLILLHSRNKYQTLKWLPNGNAVFWQRLASSNMLNTITFLYQEEWNCFCLVSDKTFWIDMFHCDSGWCILERRHCDGLSWWHRCSFKCVNVFYHCCRYDLRAWYVSLWQWSVHPRAVALRCHAGLPRWHRWIYWLW